jgi:phage baseplate assembly protein W
MTYKEDYFRSSVLKEITVQVPLEIDNNNSGFKTIKEDEMEKAINYDLKSIIMTIPGERMDPEFGVGIQRFLFENITPMVISKIKTSVRSQVATYMPWLSEFELDLSANSEKQSISLSIKYKINNPEIVGNFNLSLDPSEL